MLENISTSTKSKVSPPPIHDRIIINGRATDYFIRFLLELRNSGSVSTDELNRIINQVNENINSINGNSNLISDLTEVVTNIINSVELNNDGTFIDFTDTNYINMATSIKDSSILLDEALYKNIKEFVISVNADKTLSNISQTVICDATNTDININIPIASSFYTSGRSERISIVKQDATNNLVNIIPTSPNLIIGETSQTINSEGDVINLITDGNNWYLGA